MNVVALHLVHDSIDCWNLLERHVERLRRVRPDVEFVHCERTEELREALRGATAAVVWGFEESWLAGAPQLEWIVTPAAGRDYFRVSPRAGLDIDYSSFHGELMAETVLGFLLADARGITSSVRLQETHDWPRAEVGSTMRPLRGATITILGFGNIGRWIGRLAKGFGTRVIGVARTGLERPDWFDDDDRVIASENLDTVLAETDYLIVSLPSGAGTDHLLDATRIGKLSTGAVVVNIGRGNAIDGAALAEALGRNELRGAYLDVFEEEPLPADSPLRRCGNVVLMPHASAISPNYLDLFLDEFIDRMERRWGPGL